MPITDEEYRRGLGTRIEPGSTYNFGAEGSLQNMETSRPIGLSQPAEAFTSRRDYNAEGGLRIAAPVNETKEGRYQRWADEDQGNANADVRRYNAAIAGSREFDTGVKVKYTDPDMAKVYSDYAEGVGNKNADVRRYRGAGLAQPAASPLPDTTYNLGNNVYSTTTPTPSTPTPSTPSTPSVVAQPGARDVELLRRLDQVDTTGALPQGVKSTMGATRSYDEGDTTLNKIGRAANTIVGLYPPVWAAKKGLELAGSTLLSKPTDSTPTQSISQPADPIADRLAEQRQAERGLAAKRAEPFLDPFKRIIFGKPAINPNLTYGLGR
jgi:hypothetical protein